MLYPTELRIPELFSNYIVIETTFDDRISFENKVWRSLVARLFWVQKATGSNPVTLKRYQAKLALFDKPI